MSRRAWIVAGLLAMSLALLGVGWVSHSLARHTLQILPLVLAASLQGRRWGPAAGAALGLFWIAIMALIWAYLLGLARINTGHFSQPEVILTGVIAAAGLAVLLAAAGGASRWGRPVAPLLAFVGFALLQFVALAGSYALPMPGF